MNAEQAQSMLENKKNNNKIQTINNKVSMDKNNLKDLKLSNSFESHIKKIEISNSINGIFFKRQTEIVDIAIVLEDMGGIFEKAFLKEKNFENGTLISEYLLALMDMGPENDPTPADFREKLNEFRIQFSINQTQDDLILRIRCLKKYLPKAFSLIFPAFLKPNFSSDNLEIAKNSIISKIQNFYQNNESVARTYFFQDIFRNSIYEASFPKIDNINLINTENLISYHSEILSGFKKIKILAVGNFDSSEEILLEEFKNFLTKISGKEKSQESNFFKNFLDFFMKSKDQKSQKDLVNLNLDEKITVIKEGEKNPQTIIRFAHKGLNVSDEEYLKFTLLMDFLGGKGLESLLMKKLREEKGLTYGIYFSPVSIKYCNYLSGTMATNSSNNKEEIINDIKNVIKNLAENGISEDDLKNLKRKAKNNISLYFKNNESVLSTILFLQKNSLNNKYFDDLPQLIEDISLESINQFAKKFFDIEQIKFVIF